MKAIAYRQTQFKAEPLRNVVGIGNVTAYQICVSHGPAIGCVLDGFPPGLEISAEEIRADLSRRATGKSRHTSQRREKDDVKEVREGFECGIKLSGFNDLKEGDILEAYKIEEHKRSLE